MKLAIDSSSFAKRYVQETGSDKLHLVLQNTSELAFSVISSDHSFGCRSISSAS